MTIIKIRLAQDIEELEIVPIGDIHLGDKHCNIKLVKKQIDYVRTHKNTYAILLGDILNNAIKSAVSNIYNDKMSPMEQLISASELFGCIKDKILAIVEGNHERRTAKEDGIELTRLIAREFGIEDRYSSGLAYIFLSFGRNTRLNSSGEHRRLNYTILCGHGSGGGGRRLGPKLNALDDMLYTADADIYICGHTHTPVTARRSHLRCDPVNKTLTMVDSLMINTNGYLEYGGYGEQNGYAPSSMEVPHLYISGISRKYYATL